MAILRSPTGTCQCACTSVSFTEKPDLATAERYLSSGRHYWNSGIFMVRAGACLESFNRHQPDLARAASSCWEARIYRSDEDILSKPALERVPAISVDYAIMEKEDRIASACPLSAAGATSEAGTACRTSFLRQLRTGTRIPSWWSENIFVHSSGRTIAGVGIEDLIIVDDDDATLIVRKGHTEKVKKVIDALKALLAIMPPPNTVSNTGHGVCSKTCWTALSAR